MSWLDEIRWDHDGLAPAIAQDFRSGRVLMMAWMNREALELTAREGRGIYWSRSRQRLWRKGEDSGHVQKLHELRLDCDNDVIILQVEQVGGIACHTGHESCFYRHLVLRGNQGEWVEVDPVLKHPDVIYQENIDPKNVSLKNADSKDVGKNADNPFVDNKSASQKEADKKDITHE
jgi:phosphoribosyl-AMP cyclohydrolase